MESVNNINAKLLSSSIRGDLEGVVDALAQGGRVAMRNYQGYSPLLAAAQNGHPDICGILLAHGSDVNEVSPETKRTALHLAVARGHEAVVKVLLSWGAIVHPQDHGGGTPLHIACQEGRLACVLALLKAGSSVFMESNDGALLIQIAASHNRVEILRALLDYGFSSDMVSCHENTSTTTIMASFLLSAGQSVKDHTTDVCSSRSS